MSFYTALKDFIGSLFARSPRPPTFTRGEIAFDTSTGKMLMWTGEEWIEVPNFDHPEFGAFQIAVKNNKENK